MILPRSTSFKLLDRGKKRTAVLIPGWATDHRIFNSLDIDFNYIIPISFSPWGFREDLAQFLLKERIKKCSLFGYSLGGFIAAEFASMYPALIDELILVSVRRRYRNEEIIDVRAKLKKNRRAYLYKFYASSFHGREEISSFKKVLLKLYLEEMDLDYLLSTVDYLGGTEIKPETLKSIDKIKIIHGEEDRIAPVREAIEIKNNLPGAQLVALQNTGHNPFFNEKVMISV